MTDESYIRGLSDELLCLEYSTWVDHKSKKMWNVLVMSELKRRHLIRKAKEYHKRRLKERVESRSESAKKAYRNRIKRDR